METPDLKMNVREDKGHALKHWGFTLILIGFLTQLASIFKIESWLWDFFTLVLIILAVPSSGRRLRWWKALLVGLSGFFLLVILLIIMFRVGQVIGVNAGVLLSCLSLFVGIVLQVWGAVFSRPHLFENATRSNPLIDRIRRI